MTDEQIVSDLQLVKVPKRDRAYKWRYRLYKKIAIALFVMLTGVAWLLGITIRGNMILVQKLQDSKTPIIMPNGALAR